MPGVRVNSNAYGFGMADSAMAHRFMVGQSFQLQGERLRAIGLYRTGQPDLENYIFLPLATAQRLYGLEGKLTTIVAAIGPSEDGQQLREAILKFLEGS